LSGTEPLFGSNCATIVQPEFSTVYHADVRPSRAQTMERLADLRSSEVPPEVANPVNTSAFIVTNPTAPFVN
jgi:hypothetical protein